MSTTPRVVCSESRASSWAVASISANRSSWSRATLSSSEWVGLTCAANRRACASSSSRTAMSASQAAAQRDLAEHRGDDAAGEVAAGRVAEDAQAVLRAGSRRASSWSWSCRWCRSPRRCRAAARTGRARGTGVDPLDDQPRQRRPAAPEPGRGPRRLACRDGDRCPEHPHTLTVRPPPDPLRAREPANRAPRPDSPTRGTKSVRLRDHHRHLGPSRPQPTSCPLVGESRRQRLRFADSQARSRYGARRTRR